MTIMETPSRYYRLDIHDEGGQLFRSKRVLTEYDAERVACALVGTETSIGLTIALVRVVLVENGTETLREEYEW